MRVDQAGQHRRLAEVNHFSARGNLDFPLGSDLDDSLTGNKHYLFRQHLAGLAVKQAAGADSDRSSSRSAFIDAAVNSNARRWTRSAPRGRRRLDLRPKRRRTQEYTDRRYHYRFASHRASLLSAN
jgi:hypothetical protein